MKKPIEIEFSFLKETYKARFWKSEYFNENLYIGVLTWNKTYGYWEEWGDLTVNLPGFMHEPNEAFININSSAKNILPILVKKGYIKETGIERKSGFCVYPLVEFTEEFMNGLWNKEEE